MVDPSSQPQEFRGSAKEAFRRMLVPTLIGLVLFAVFAWKDPGFRPMAKFVFIGLLVGAALGPVNAAGYRLSLSATTLSMTMNKRRPTEIPLASIRHADVRYRSEGLLGNILGTGLVDFATRGDVGKDGRPRSPRMILLTLDGKKRPAIMLTQLAVADRARFVQALRDAGVPFDQPSTVPGSVAEAVAKDEPTGTLPVGMLLGALVGAAGALLWALVIRYTGYEIGILATVIGAGCGWTMRRFGGPATVVTGAMAALFAIAATIAGNFLGLGWYLGDKFAKEGNAIDWAAYTDIFVHHPTEFFGLLDLLFWALAVYAAWRIAGPRVGAKTTS